MANIPHIILKGGDWFSKIGSKNSPGTKLYCLSGDVKKPGVYELPTNVTLKDLIYKYAGGPKGEIKAILPGGVSSPVLLKEDLDVVMDYKEVEKRGSILGSGAVIVINKKRCMVDINKRILDFFNHESCGRCVPCREGVKRAKEILEFISEGKADLSDLKLLEELQEVLADTSLCGLGQAALNCVRSSIDKFYEEFKEHIVEKKCKTGVCRVGK